MMHIHYRFWWKTRCQDPYLCQANSHTWGNIAVALCKHLIRIGACLMYVLVEMVTKAVELPSDNNSFDILPSKGGIQMAPQEAQAILLAKKATWLILGCLRLWMFMCNFLFIETWERAKERPGLEPETTRQSHRSFSKWATRRAHI